MRRGLPAIAAIGVLLLAAACDWPPDAREQLAPLGTPVAAPATLDARKVAQGRSVYQVHCAQCHGPEGEGHPDWREQNPDGTLPPPPHDHTGHTWHHSDGVLYRYVRDGGEIYENGFKSAMPAFGDQLTPDEIRAVITYLKTMWGPDERAFQAGVSMEDPFPDE